MTTCSTRKCWASLSAPGKSVSQILQDFGMLDLDTILQVIASHLGASGRHARRARSDAGVAADHPGQDGANVPMPAGGPVSIPPCKSPWWIRSIRGASTSWASSSRRTSNWSWPTPRRSRRPSRSSTPRRTKAVTDILKELGSDKEIGQGNQRGGRHRRRDDDGPTWPTRRPLSVL